MKDIKDPKFLEECEVESRKIHERNKERDYAKLLEQRAIDETMLRVKVRIAFEKECV